MSQQPKGVSNQRAGKNSLELNGWAGRLGKPKLAASRPCEWSKGVAKERRQAVCSSVKCWLAVFLWFLSLAKNKNCDSPKRTHKGNFAEGYKSVARSPQRPAGELNYGRRRMLIRLMERSFSEV